MFQVLTNSVSIPKISHLIFYKHIILKIANLLADIYTDLFLKTRRVFVFSNSINALKMTLADVEFDFKSLIPLLPTKITSL